MAEQALHYDSRFLEFARPVLVNGAAGVVATGDGRVYSVMAFTVARHRIVEIDVVTDPARLWHLDLTDLDTAH